MTNAEAIRSLPDEKLAFYLYDRCGCGEYCTGTNGYERGSPDCYYWINNNTPRSSHCTGCILKWLKSDAETQLPELSHYHDDDDEAYLAYMKLED